MSNKTAIQVHKQYSTGTVALIFSENLSMVTGTSYPKRRNVSQLSDKELETLSTALGTKIQLMTIDT